MGINNNPLSGARHIASPFVGHKRSGYGSHSGVDGWRAFSTPKTLIYPSGLPPTHSLPTLAQGSAAATGGNERACRKAAALATLAAALVAGVALLSMRSRRS